MNECWLFAGHISKGYGLVWDGERQRVAHRVMYEALVGDIPEGKVLDHLCRIKRCINPEHLEVVSSRTNTLRGYGVTAVNQAKTHCIRGHEFTSDNTLIRKDTGYRLCRTCERARWKRINARRRELNAKRAAGLRDD